MKGGRIPSTQTMFQPGSDSDETPVRWCGEIGRSVFVFTVSLLLVGLPIFTWFRSSVDFDVFPFSGRGWWESEVVVETGLHLVRPVYWFVSQVMVKVDFRYACAGPWHPVFLWGFGIVAVSHAITLTFLWFCGGHSFRRLISARFRRG